MYFVFCRRKSVRFGITWERENDYNIEIFDWTIPLTYYKQYWCLVACFLRTSNQQTFRLISSTTPPNLICFSLGQYNIHTISTLGFLLVYFSHFIWSIGYPSWLFLLLWKGCLWTELRAWEDACGINTTI